MRNVTFRWIVGLAVRAVYRRRTITVTGEAGVPFRFRPAEYPTLLRGVWRVDRDLRNEWTRLLAPGDVILDVGANIGTTVQRFHSILHGNCQIWAFEPMPRNLELLEANASALEPPCVHVVPCAVGERDGDETFCDNVGHGALSRRATLLKQNNERWPLYWKRYSQVSVRMLTLDTFADEHPDVQPTFLKIDVEGAGGGVIEGAKRMLAKHRPIVSCEFHSDDERNGITQRLADLGYRGLDFRNDGRFTWCKPDQCTGQFAHPDSSRTSQLDIESMRHRAL